MSLKTVEEKKAFIAGFSHIEDSSDVKRSLFILYAKDNSETDATWIPLGYKQESASVSNNYDEEDYEDILGNVYNDITAKKETIEMSEYHFNKDKSAFLDKAHMYTQAGLEAQLSNYSLLMVSRWLENSNKECFARQIDGVTLRLDNTGGQGYTMADVAFSGISEGNLGSVTYDETGKIPTFTAA